MNFIHILIVTVLLVGGAVEVIFLCCPQCTRAIRDWLRNAANRIYAVGCSHKPAIVKTVPSSRRA